MNASPTLYFSLFHEAPLYEKDGSLIIGFPVEYHNCDVIYIGEELGNDEDPITGLPLFHQSDFAFLFYPFPYPSQLPKHLYELAHNAIPMLPVIPPPPPKPKSNVLDMFLVGFASPTIFPLFFPQNEASDSETDVKLSRSDLYQLFKGYSTKLLQRGRMMHGEGYAHILPTTIHASPGHSGSPIGLLGNTAYVDRLFFGMHISGPPRSVYNKEKNVYEPQALTLAQLSHNLAITTTHPNYVAAYKAHVLPYTLEYLKSEKAPQLSTDYYEKYLRDK